MVERTKYDVLLGGEWCKCLRAAPTGKAGWLHYQLKDGTNGLAYNRPGQMPKWRTRPVREPRIAECWTCAKCPTSQHGSLTSCIAATHAAPRILKLETQHPWWSTIAAHRAAGHDVRPVAQKGE